MPVLPNIGLITPTLGGDRGVWDDKVNACFALADAHDHTAGKGLAIATAAININADLPIGGYSLTTVGKISFSTITLPSAGSLNLFVNTADNELYWRTSSGTNVKLTSGTTINVSLVGGIAGDYTSVSAQVAFDDSNDRYTFKQNNATGWAKMASGDVRIYEAGTSESVYVGLKAPAALAASYDITLPLVLPGEVAPLTMDSSGNVTTSAVRTLVVPPAAFVVVNGSAAFTHGIQQSTALGIDAVFPLALPVGARIKAMRVYVRDNVTGPTKLQASLRSGATTGAAVVTIASSAVSAGDASDQTLTVASASTVVAAAKSYVLYLTTTTGTASCGLYMAEVDYDYA